MDVSDDGEVEEFHTPLRIVADWRRFACGLWRLPKGDIASAYCSDIFPKLKTFSHEGRLYMNGGSMFSCPIRTSACCYALIPPDQYSGPQSVRYSYEGKEGRFQGRPFRMGPKIIFESSDPTVEEWTQMIRIFYADGGMFAHGVTYREYLDERHSPKSANERVAHAAELVLCESTEMPETQAEMKLLLEVSITRVSQIQPQLELAF